MSAANASPCTIASSQSCPGIMSRPQQGRARYRVAAPRTRAAQTRRVERTGRGQLLIPDKTASTALVAPGMHGCVKAESAWSVSESGWVHKSLQWRCEPRQARCKLRAYIYALAALQRCSLPTLQNVFCSAVAACSVTHGPVHSYCPPSG